MRYVDVAQCVINELSCSMWTPLMNMGMVRSIYLCTITTSLSLTHSESVLSVLAEQWCYHSPYI